MSSDASPETICLVGLRQNGLTHLFLKHIELSTELRLHHHGPLLQQSSSANPQMRFGWTYPPHWRIFAIDEQMSGRRLVPRGHQSLSVLHSLLQARGVIIA